MLTLYEYSGGEGALHKFIETFYRSVLLDPLLKRLFGDGRPEHVAHLTAFTAETFGGPDRFSKEMGGFSHLIDVHRGLKITEEQRQRFVALYLEAADAAQLPKDPRFRKALREHVEFGSEVARQNSHAETDEELHPLREVPKWNWPDDAD
jgi:hemoglobin